MRCSGPLESIDALGLMGWDVVAVGWDRGWVMLQDVICFALDRLMAEEVAEEDLNTVMSLALAESGMLDHLDIKELLNRLTRNSFDRATASGMDKWRLVFLMELDAAPLDWNAKVTRIQELMAEFGYPPDMSACFRYGPSQFAIDAGFASPEDLNRDPLAEMQIVISSLKTRLCRE